MAFNTAQWCLTSPWWLLLLVSEEDWGQCIHVEKFYKYAWHSHLGKKRKTCETLQLGKGRHYGARCTMVFYFRLYTCLRERQSYLGKNIYSMMRLTLPMKILFSYTRLNQRPYLEKIKHVLLKSITGWSSAIFSAKCKASFICWRWKDEGFKFYQISQMY